MAEQDLRTLVPRVRRALEGPLASVSQTALADEAIIPMIADAVADVILLTVGGFGHQLLVTGRDTDYDAPNAWTVDPVMTPDEESVIVAQTAITFFTQQFGLKKVQETIRNEGREWSYQLSANLLRDQMKALTDMRDKALQSVMVENPAMARYASILLVRDRVAAAILEPWTTPGGLGGGIPLLP